MNSNIAEHPANPPAEDTNSKPDSAKPRVRTSGRRAKTKSTKTTTRNTKTASPVRSGTKAAKIVHLLQRPNGASLQELRKATGWQPHSVRGFLSGALKKKLGLHVRSTKREGGERAYRLATK